MRRKLIGVKVGESLKLGEMRQELDEMTDVLLGRVPAPIESGVITLMEVAEAYYARATEMQMQIQRGEATGAVAKGSAPYKFRTGELRSFRELAKAAMELGSRRVTQAKLEMEMEE